jgi:hypothetical protein
LSSRARFQGETVKLPFAAPTYLSHAPREADDDPVALVQRRVWEAQKIVAGQKRRIALAFALLEL